jgi:hypothetical protein
VEEGGAAGPAARYDAEAAATVRREWLPWCQSLVGTMDAATMVDQVVSYLQIGLPAETVAALVRTRLGSRQVTDRDLLVVGQTHCERVRAEVGELGRLGVITGAAAGAIEREYTMRLAALREAEVPIVFERAQAAAEPAPAEPAPPVVEGIGAEAAATPPYPPRRSGEDMLRELFTEHAVVILASLGAFLLVVAAVLFELYGTAGLGGGVRLAAVVALDLIFAAAGYLALGQQRLRAVGQIYVALAAVLLPLVGVAAWTFLALGRQGITVDEALAVTGAACSLVYGFLARRLDLRPYADMAGIAVFATVWGISGAAAGESWRSVGLGLTPLVYAAWQRLSPAGVFSHFPWFAHASALIALVAMAVAVPDGRSTWLWTATFGAIAAAYLAWQALAPHPSRVWTGEAAVVLAATAAAGALGGSYRFALPLAAGVPLLLLARAAGRLGAAGRLYRSHPAHLHMAVFLGVVLALAQNQNGEAWPLSLALWIALALYAIDFALGPSEATGYALRAALPLALATTGRAAGWGAWTGTAVAVSGLAYLLPHLRPSRLGLVTRNASPFFYAVVVLSAIELRDAAIGTGRWQLPVALLVAATAFGIASELGAVRFSDLAARALFSLAWFVGVEALGAQSWRGPFDALLALLYVALGELRAAAAHAVATARRREFVHAAALVAVALCLTGPGDLLWWRLAAALGLLAVGYGWLATGAREPEMPWLAWSALAASVGAVVLAAVPESCQGTAMVAGALALTAGWAAAAWRFPRTAPLEKSGLPVLGVLATIGAGLTLRGALPQWSQASAALLAGGVLLAWSLLQPGPTSLRQALRVGAAGLATIGLLLGAAVLRLDTAWVGLLVVAIGVAHAEWHARARGETERHYALAALLAMGLVLVAWPYADTLPAVLVLEFVVLSALTAATAVRVRSAYVVYPAVLLLVPGVHVGLIAAGIDRSGGIEETVMAGLAVAAGLAGLALHTRFAAGWARMTELGAATIAVGSLLALAQRDAADAAGIALLAYASIIYTAAMQEREHRALPVAAAAVVVGAFTLLGANGADTILYAAGLGMLGLTIWIAGRLTFRALGRHAVVEMHRYLGLGLLGVAAIAGFVFPDKTGPASLGAALAAAGLLIVGGILWMDARAFGWRPNRYLGLVSATAAGYFLARELAVQSWELVPPGLGLVACGILLREDRDLGVQLQIRQVLVGAGIGLVMGWAVVLTVNGDSWWLGTLLLEGALTVGAGIVLRSRVLLAGGGAALALVSLRALLIVAQAGYLFVAFGAVALVLLGIATVLALNRDRYGPGARGVRERLAQWD